MAESPKQPASEMPTQFGTAVGVSSSSENLRPEETLVPPSRSDAPTVLTETPSVSASRAGSQTDSRTQAAGSGERIGAGTGNGTCGAIRGSQRAGHGRNGLRL